MQKKSLNEESLYSSETSIKLHPVTLAFRQEQSKLENKFLNYYLDNSLKSIRISLIFVFLLFSIFGILDAYLAPKNKELFWFLRYAIFCPFTLAIFALTYHVAFNKIIQPALASLMIIGAGCIIYMTFVAPSLISSTYYTGLILVFMGAYTFMKMRFIWATGAGTTIIILYDISVATQPNIPINIFIANNFFLLSANIMGMYACYTIEYYARHDFFTNYLLIKQTEKLSKINDHLEEVSLTDHLTGLPNRRHAMKIMSNLWNESFNKNLPMVGMMIDADHFKTVNDKYGHDVGDSVLTELAKTLQYSIRNDDTVCRLGGDEFFVICPVTHLEGGIKIAETLCKRVSELQVKTGDTIWKGSVSIGVSSITPDMEGYEDIIKLADLGVYKAKADGKNCVRTVNK